MVKSSVELDADVIERMAAEGDKTAQMLLDLAAIDVLLTQELYDLEWEEREPIYVFTGHANEVTDARRLIREGIHRMNHAFQEGFNAEAKRLIRRLNRKRRLNCGS